MRHWSILAIVLVLPACAGEMAMRSVSGQSAAVLNQYRSAFRDFAARQTESSAANAHRLNRINDLRDERTSEIQSRTRAWRVGGNQPSLSNFSTLTANNAESIVASLLPPPRASGGEALRFDPAPVDAVIKQLLELQQPRTPAERAGDMLDFTAQVREAFDNSVAAAATQARTAQDETSDNTQQTSSTATSTPPQ